jgi:hypothetical protein
LSPRRVQNSPHIVGTTWDDLPDEDEIYRRAVDEWKRTERLIKRRSDQRIEFRRGPIAIVFVADLHLGSNGVDYERAFREAQIVADTPGMYVMLIGDLLDNFIVPKLVSARHDARITVQEEWALVRKYLQVISRKLLCSVRGNHERWTWMLAGIDYFADVLKSVNARVVYDTDDLLISLRVGAAQFPIRLRHRWLGSSIYNDTHGIERAAKFDGDFLVGVGAHTHASGLVRTFNSRGQNGMAVLCGSYKRFDPFARERGFTRANSSTAQTVLFFESGAMVGIDRLEIAAEVMEKYAQRK